MIPELNPIQTKKHIPKMRLIILTLLYALLFPIHASSAAELEEIKEAMIEYLVCSPVDIVNLKQQQPIVTQKSLCLSSIYEGVSDFPLWINANGLSENGWIIINHLKNSAVHGLDPERYNINTILDLLPSQNAADLAQLETLLSYGLVLYIHDINHGQLEPRQSNPQLFAEAGSYDFNPLEAIKNCLAADDLHNFLESLAPQHDYYKNLLSALKQYRRLEADGGWPVVPEGPTLRPGDIDPRIKDVWFRLLKYEGADLLLPTTIPSFYDDALKDAVLRFQARHHLEKDGVIGPQTLAAMNVTVSERIETIRLNMARWRWQSHDLGDKYVIVNIAGFNLKGVNNNEVVLDMPVIVGKNQHQTPVFSDSIKYLDFNPFWNIPPSIARDEELPKLKQNPFHLVERQVRLFSSWNEGAVELDSTAVDWHQITRSQISTYLLRQDPGSWNALGKLKFVFPNKYSVYMHGTPSQGSFKRRERSFSHGCIRLSDPPALAGFILKDQQGQWTDEKIAEIYNQDSRKVIRLSQPVPIHITYQTSWVDKDGTINFNNDTYARDAKLHQALNR
jgi:murein L,D-transpeptidase YcbB/YkuD